MMSDLPFVPIGMTVLAEEAVETKDGDDSLIIIPEAFRDPPQQFKIIALGSGAKDKKGKDIAWNVKVGDVVITTGEEITEVHVGGRPYRTFHQDNIIALVEDD
jgi:chaperonin GroES